jgi:hypothetical protein
MAKNPKEHLTNIQDRQAGYLDAQAKTNSSNDPASLTFWLPSGVTAKVPRHEVLMLRDLCNNFMAQHGAEDIMGRGVENWGRPHPEIEPRGTQGTEPSDSGQPNAG